MWRKRETGDRVTDSKIDKKKQADGKKVRCPSPEAGGVDYLNRLYKKQRDELEKSNRKRIAVLRREQNRSETEQVCSNP